MKNNKGYSLIEVLIATVLISIVTMGISSLIYQSVVQTNYVKNKVEFNGYLQLASNILGKPNGCDCNFTGASFDSTDPNYKKTIPSILESCAAGAGMFIKKSTTPGIARYEAQDLYLANFSPTGNPDEFSAEFYITPKTQGVPLKPVGIPIIFNTAASSPNNAKVINGCGQILTATPPTLQNPIAGNGQCIVNWTASSGEQPITYYLKQSTVSGQASNGTLIGMTTALGYLVTGLTNGTTYYFSVQAANIRGTTTYSGEKTCTPVGLPCTSPWGGPNITDGTTISAYQSSSVTSPAVCISESRTCNNGDLSGSYSNQSCSVTYLACNSPWGTTMNNGDSIVAYQSASVTSPATCVSETRTCSNGILSGSYTSQTCNVNTLGCLTPWGATVANGASVTAYSTTTGACYPQTRTCTNGVLSGSYTDQTCKPFWHCTPGTRPEASGQGVANVTWIATCSGRFCHNPGCTCNSPGFNYTPAIGTSCTYNSWMSGGNNYTSCVYSCSYY